MTCIVAVVHEGAIYMGGDTGMSDRGNILMLDGSKIAINGDFILGAAGSPRATQLFSHVFSAPERKVNETTPHYMEVSVVQAFKDMFEADNWTQWQKGDRGNEESDSKTPGLGHTAMLIGYDGHLYLLDPACNMIPLAANYMAIGTGEDIATGALYALSLHDAQPEAMVQIALEAASHHMHDIRPPFTVMKLEAHDDTAYDEGEYDSC